MAGHATHQDLGKSRLAAAIRYALTRKERLRPYFNSGILEFDNNASERGIHPIALSRKNHVFVGCESRLQRRRR